MLRLFARFPCERTHKVVKRCASGRLNTTSYEQCLFEEVLDQHFWELRRPLVTDELADAREASTTMRDAVVAELGLSAAVDVTTSLASKVDGRYIHNRDVVRMADGTVAAFFCAANGRPYACVSHWPVSRVLPDRCVNVCVRDGPVVPLDQLVCSLISRTAYGVQTVLLP